MYVPVIMLAKKSSDTRAILSASSKYDRLLLEYSIISIVKLDCHRKLDLFCCRASSNEANAVDILETSTDLTHLSHSTTVPSGLACAC